MHLDTPASKQGRHCLAEYSWRPASLQRHTKSPARRDNQLQAAQLPTASRLKRAGEKLCPGGTQREWGPTQSGRVVAVVSAARGYASACNSST